MRQELELVTGTHGRDRAGYAYGFHLPPGPAQAAYAAWGWRTVAQLGPHRDDAPLYDVLIRA